MKWLPTEGNKLINLDNIDKIEMLSSKRKAVLWAAGVPVDESTIVYEYFMHPSVIEGFVKLPKE